MKRIFNGKSHFWCMKKKAIIVTTNDITTDNRVHRVSMLLLEMGFDVHWVGRELPGSMPIERPYSTRRFKLWFTKGALFYASFNLRLFWYLLFKRFDILICNDLDTLLGGALACRIKGSRIVYDTHEYFTGVPEIQGRPWVKRAWRSIEKAIFPKLQHIITVNRSIADLYKREYGKELIVVRNIADPPGEVSNITRSEIGIPEGRFLFINQGTGINVDRGMEEFLEALPLIPNAHLLLVGSGDVLPRLKAMAAEAGLEDRVTFVDRQPYHRLLGFTKLADVGLSLDKDTNINYRFSLPNKVFDYIHSDIPILASGVVEVRSIVEKYGIGEIIPDHRPHSIAEKAKLMMLNGKESYLKGLGQARLELTWERERQPLINLYSTLGH
ncbi:MAG: glycosyltransferase [Bacteroidota bacterium]|nr:glycosyltransferase [Bacteroidota bacterium]MDX5506033.1 glycosyltransferase [Bacteroidota bacterium]